MGCWSEGCCISDLEIADGDDIVVAFILKTKYDDLNAGAFGQYRPVTPLLRGKYNDYGGCDVHDTPENIALFEKAWLVVLNTDPDFDPTTFEFPDNVRMDDVPEGCRLWMAHADGLDMLRTVRHEFTMDETAPRVGDTEKRTYDLLMAAYPNIEKKKWLLEMYDKEKTPNSDEMKVYTLGTSVLTGGEYNRGVPRYDVPAVAVLLMVVLDNLTDQILFAQIAKHIAELHMLQDGLSELRKSLHPQFRTGPQHDGWLAQEDFAEYLNARIKLRAIERAETQRQDAVWTQRYNVVVDAYKADNDGRQPTPEEVAALMRETTV